MYILKLVPWEIRKWLCYSLSVGNTSVHLVQPECSTQKYVMNHCPRNLTPLQCTLTAVLNLSGNWSLIREYVTQGCSNEIRPRLYWPEEQDRDQFIPMLNYISTMPWIHMGSGVMAPSFLWKWLIQSLDLYSGGVGFEFREDTGYPERGFHGISPSPEIPR
jgi:hypothetical protein